MSEMSADLTIYPHHPSEKGNHFGGFFQTLSKWGSMELLFGVNLHFSGKFPAKLDPAS